MSEPIRVEQFYPVTRQRLWKAITDLAEMHAWFFDNIPEFRAEVGFETGFAVTSDDREFHHLWKVIEVKPAERLVIDWRYRDHQGVGIVTFDLSDELGGSKLRVTNDGLDSFSTDVAEFSRESCEEGWTFLIQGTLKDHLES